MGQASYKIRCYRQWWENQHRGCTVDYTLSCKYYIQLSIKRLFVVKKRLKMAVVGLITHGMNRADWQHFSDDFRVP